MFSQNCFIFTCKKLFHLSFDFSILSILKKINRDIFLFESVQYNTLQSSFCVFREVEPPYKFLLALSRFSSFFHGLAWASCSYLKLGIFITMQHPEMNLSHQWRNTLYWFSEQLLYFVLSVEAFPIFFSISYEIVCFCNVLHIAFSDTRVQ